MDDKLRKQLKRRDPIFREKERERERNRKRLRRMDPLYRAAERNRDKLRRRALRGHLQICTEEWQKRDSNFSLDFIPVETILKEECDKLPNSLEVSSVVCKCLSHECTLTDKCETTTGEAHALHLCRCEIPLTSKTHGELNERVTEMTEDLRELSSYQSDVRTISFYQNLLKQREQERIRKQRKRQNATYRELERERQKIRMRILRADPVFRSKEREQQRLAVSFKRRDPEYRALVKLHQKCNNDFSMNFIPVETVLKEGCEQSLRSVEVSSVACTNLAEECICSSERCETTPCKSQNESILPT